MCVGTLCYAFLSFIIFLFLVTLYWIPLLTKADFSSFSLFKYLLLTLIISSYVFLLLLTNIISFLVPASNKFD